MLFLAFESERDKFMHLNTL